MEKSPVERKHTTILGANVSVLLLMVLNIIVSTILLFAISLFTAFSGGISDIQAYMNTVIKSFAFNMITLSTIQLFIILPISLVYLQSTKRSLLDTMRLRKGIDLVQILLLAAVCFCCIYFANPLNNLFMMLLQKLGYQPTVSDFSISNVPQLMVGIAVIAFLPPFCEEFLFRGVVLRSYERYSPVMAVIMSAFLFGFMHATFEQILPTFIIGLILATVVLVTDSLWASILIHLLNNGFALIINYYATHSGIAEQTPTLSPMAEVISNLFFIVVFGAGLALSLYLFITYTRRRNQKVYGQPLSKELFKGYATQFITTKENPYTGQPVKVTPAGSHPVLAYLPLAAFILVVLFNLFYSWL